MDQINQKMKRLETALQTSQDQCKSLKVENATLTGQFQKFGSLSAENSELHAQASMLLYSSRFVCVSVSVCVCLRLFSELQATRRLMSNTNSFSATRARKKCGDFAETTAFERYGVKTS